MKEPNGKSEGTKKSGCKVFEFREVYDNVIKQEMSYMCILNAHLATKCLLTLLSYYKYSRKQPFCENTCVIVNTYVSTQFFSECMTNCLNEQISEILNENLT